MNFEGAVSSSKSLVNRYLILQKGYPELNLKWSSQARDVLFLDKALKDFSSERELYIGEGGTTLRFLAAFLSTQKGEWRLKGNPSLFKRPQKTLIDALEQVGSQAVLGEDYLDLISQGWTQNKVNIDLSKTSQVATAFILSALASKQELEMSLLSYGKASGYLDLTLKFIKDFGFSTKKEGTSLKIFANQELKEEISFKHIESDWSSAAFIFVLGALLGKARVFGLFRESLQPDSAILKILEESGVQVSYAKAKVTKSEIPYLPLNLNLQKCPDLFPVLSVFACFCRGASRLYGAPQLIYKESNRLEWIYRLLVQCGYKVSRLEDGLKIQGAGFRVQEHKPFTFDVSSDHRLFMAAEILKKMSYKIEIKGEESIKKSFPEYLDLEL